MTGGIELILKTVATSLVGLGVAYFSMPFFRGLAIRYRIVDFPGKRKMHRTATPLLGGAAIYAGFMAAVFLNMPLTKNAWAIITGGTIILLLGLADDAWGLSARFRLAVQFVAALIVVMLGDRIQFLPRGQVYDMIEVLISLVWIIGITNAFNYLDGLDGLAAGCAVINALCFGGILYRTGQFMLFVVCIILAGACLGFLPYNFSGRKRKVFLGDAGSTFLGFVLAGIGLCGYWAEGDFVKISIPILVLGVPIFDMVFTTVMRIAEKKIRTVHEWLKYAGKDHFHHYLVDIQLPTPAAVIFIYFTSIALGLSAMIASVVGPITAALSVFQGVIIFGIIGVLIVMGKRSREGQ